MKLVTYKQYYLFRMEQAGEAAQMRAERGHEYWAMQEAKSAFHFMRLAGISPWPEQNLNINVA